MNDTKKIGYQRIMMGLTAIFVPGGFIVIGGVLIYKGIKKLREAKK